MLTLSNTSSFQQAIFPMACQTDKRDDAHNNLEAETEVFDKPLRQNIILYFADEPMTTFSVKEQGRQRSPCVDLKCLPDQYKCGLRV